MRIGIVLVCNGEQGTTMTKDWFTSDEDPHVIQFRILQLAITQYSGSELHALESQDLADTYLFAMIIEGEDPDLVHWFRFRQTAIGKPYR